MWRYVLPRVALIHYQYWQYSYPYAARMIPRQHAHRGSSSSSGSTACKHVSLLFALAAVCTVPQPVLAEHATAATVVQEQQPSSLVQKEQQQDSTCSFYGCPLLAQDIYFNTVVRKALSELRNAAQTKAGITLQGTALESCGSERMATLTLLGYKGGDPLAQVNQDRALIVSPFRLGLDSGGDQSETEATSTAAAPDGTTCRLLGVFDGHAKLGEHVSEYVVTELPKLLAKKLQPIYNDNAAKRNGDNGDSENDNDSIGRIQQQQEQATKQALTETFVELDKTAPAEISGGCTASVILQMGRKVYIANAGDSVSFLAVYHQESNRTQVIYTSREDKPTLQQERARVEKMGGQVYAPERGTSRVLYTDPMTGYQSGLAMSRSIGDWAAGKVGVIPDPIVDVIDIPDVVQAASTLPSNDNMCVVIDENGDMNMEPCQQVGKAVDDVYIFAVSATDGLTDFLDPLSIAQTLAPSLYDDSNGTHVLTACEMLISAAANGWERAKQGRYRDDIAIAVSTIRIPPPRIPRTDEHRARVKQ